MIWFTLHKCSRNIYLEVSFLWVIVQSRHEKTQLWDRKIWKSPSFLERKSDITPSGEKINGRQIVEILSCVKIPAHGRTPPDAAFVFGVRCERLDPTSKDAGWATFDSSADLILRAEVQGIAELGSSLLVLSMVRSLEKDLQNPQALWVCDRTSASCIILLSNPRTKMSGRILPILPWSVSRSRHVLAAGATQEVPSPFAFRVSDVCMASVKTHQ